MLRLWPGRERGRRKRDVGWGEEYDGRMEERKERRGKKWEKNKK